MAKIVNSVKIYGIIFGQDAQLTMETDLKHRIDGTLSILRVRRLTHLGRVVLLNNIILAKLWYVASVTVLSNNFLSWLQGRIFGFLWPKIEKIKRHVVYLPVVEGGLGIIDVTAKCQSLLVKHAAHVIEHPETKSALLAAYWTALPLRKYIQTTWSNITPHSTSPNYFYKEVITDFKHFKSKFPSLISPKMVTKTAYNFFLRETAVLPRILDKSETEPEITIGCWKALAALPLSATSRDLIWQASHGVLQVASQRFKFHMAIHNLCTRCFTAVESIKHALVLCPSASTIWKMIYDLVPGVRNTSTISIIHLDLAHKDRFELKYKSIVLAEAMYLNWLFRNKKCFDDHEASSAEQTNRLKAGLKLRVQSDFLRYDRSTFDAIWGNRPLKIIQYTDGNINIQF